MNEELQKIYGDTHALLVLCLMGAAAPTTKNLDATLKFVDKAIALLTNLKSMLFVLGVIGDTPQDKGKYN